MAAGISEGSSGEESEEGGEGGGSGGSGPLSPAAAATAPAPASMTTIPLNTLGVILSYLPSAQLCRAVRVCREWQAEISAQGIPAAVGCGAVFGGVVPPHPLIFASFCGRLRAARDFSFAGCGWLTGGALLMALGVPIGVAVTAPAPVVEGVLVVGGGGVVVAVGR